MEAARELRLGDYRVEEFLGTVSVATEQRGFRGFDVLSTLPGLNGLSQSGACQEKDSER